MEVDYGCRGGGAMALGCRDCMRCTADFENRLGWRLVSQPAYDSYEQPLLVFLSDRSYVNSRKRLLYIIN
jgi:hypothetical protein